MTGPRTPRTPRTPQTPRGTGTTTGRTARRTARRVALDALIAIDWGARANVVVPELLTQSDLDTRDRHLVTELAYGATRMQRACDWLVGRYTRGKLDDEVRAALRLGAYQLGWTRIPAHAAVSATVDEVRGPGRKVVNAVLRRVAAEISDGLVTWPDRATELSYPDWIVERLNRDLGRDAALAALRTMNQPASMTVRADGYVQDEASQMVAAHLDARPGQKVLDMCAAPGGKATAMAARGPSLVAAGDISWSRTQMVAANAARLRAEAIQPVVADCTLPPFAAQTFDLVLVDAPCSGLGVLRRRPDARWHIRPEDIDRLSGLQRRLLRAAIPLVRPGGLLAYSVCTVTPAETAAMDNWLAKNEPQLIPLPPPPAPWRAAGRGALLLPQDAGTDGMYLLTLRTPG